MNDLDRLIRRRLLAALAVWGDRVAWAVAAACVVLGAVLVAWSCRPR